MPSTALEDEDSMVSDGDAGSSDELSIQEMNRRAHAAMAGLRAEASRLAGAGA